MFFHQLPYFLGDNDSDDDDDDDDDGDDDDDDHDGIVFFNYRHLAASSFFRFLCQLFICPSYGCLFVNSIYCPAILVKLWFYLAELQNETQNYIFGLFTVCSQKRVHKTLINDPAHQKGH